MILSRDLVFAKEPGGKTLIKGVTAKLGVPISCPVRVYSRDTGELLFRTVSKPDGQYIAIGSHRGNYVIAVDPIKEFNIAAQDNVK